MDFSGLLGITKCRRRKESVKAKLFLFLNTHFLDHTFADTINWNHFEGKWYKSYFKYTTVIYNHVICQ